MSFTMATDLGIISTKPVGKALVQVIASEQPSDVSETTTRQRTEHTNTQKKFDVDPSVRPVAQKLKQMPVHMQEAVGREILNQEEE